MKPQFALDLSHTGIRLLQLGKQGESEIGAVALDDPEFERHVYDLYQIAESRTKGRVRAQLIIPNSEVLYTRIETGEGDREARAAAVADALQGMTPYDLEELVFDWRAEGEEALVAAVARETLEEAESFATRHGFNPVGFSARPANGAFRGVPNFGPTKLVEARKAGEPWPDPPKAPPASKPASEQPRPESQTSEDTATAPKDDAAPTTAAEAPPAQAPAQPTGQALDHAASPYVAAKAGGADTETAPTVAKGAVATEAQDPPETAALPDLRPADQDKTAEAPKTSTTDSKGVSSTDEDGTAGTPVEREPSDKKTARHDKGPSPRAEKGMTDTAAPEEAAEVKDPDGPDAPAGESGATAEKTSRTEAADKPKAKETTAGQSDTSTAPPENKSGDGVDAPAPPTPEEAAPGNQAEDAAADGRKRGAGRTTTKTGSKTELATEKPAPDLPAFSSRRAAGTPPPRPPNLPPAGNLPKDGTPPPPRPRIPPHLSKTTAALRDASSEDDKSGLRSSRLTALMTRLQRVPDGGNPLDSQRQDASGNSQNSLDAALKPDEKHKIDGKTGKATTEETKAKPSDGPAKPSAATLPKEPEVGTATASAPKPGAPNGPQGKAPRAKPAVPPRVTPVAQDVPEQSAAAESLVPRLGTARDSADPGPALPDRTGLNEAESMTLFGARNMQKKERSMAPVLVGIAVVLVLAVAVWASVLVLGRDDTEGADVGALVEEPAEGLAELTATPSEESQGDAPETAPTETAALTPDDSGAPAPPLSEGPTLTAPTPEPDAPPDSEPEPGTRSDGDTAAMAPDATQAPEPDAAIGTQEEAQPLPDPDSLDEALSRYAAIGIWQIAPDPPPLPEGGRIDDLRIARLDSDLALSDPAALGPAPQDSAPEPPQAGLPPLPPGTEIDLGPDGQVVATPEGALTPQGVRVHAGSPAATPPTRPPRPPSLREAVPVNPETLPDLRPRERPEDAVVQDSALDPDTVPATDSPADQDAEAGAEIREATIVPGSPEPATGSPERAGAIDLAALTPVSPADEADPPAEEAEETEGDPAVSSAPAEERPEEFALRPAPRSEAVTRATSDLQTGSGAPQSSTAGVLTIPSPPARPAALASLVQEGDDAAEDAATADDALPESPYAVIRSLKPASRPEYLEERVARARAAQPAPAVEPAATVAPSGPTTASVAQAATETRVLNMSRVNLIGVYGSSSDRRALVRLPSGSFVKVKVGDRVDGGRVASISEDELLYVKGGRNITLEIPQG